MPPVPVQGKPPHHDVVRACHRLPEASALEEERRLQRVATRGGGA